MNEDQIRVLEFFNVYDGNTACSKAENRAYVINDWGGAGAAAPLPLATPLTYRQKAIEIG